MRTTAILLSTLCIMGCYGPETVSSDGGTDCVAKDATPVVDQAPPTKCPAAKGLAGDNLGICVDFSSLPDQTLTSTPPPQLAGWSFGKDSSNNDCWEIQSGKLQIRNFDRFADTCRITLPQIDLNDADKQKYKAITLSIVQKIDLDIIGSGFPSQLAQIYNGVVIQSLLLTQTSGTLPEQQFSLTLDKQNLPTVTPNVAKYIIQVQSGKANNTKQGLKISSIAVHATP